MIYINEILNFLVQMVCAALNKSVFVKSQGCGRKICNNL